MWLSSAALLLIGSFEEIKNQIQHLWNCVRQLWAPNANEDEENQNNNNNGGNVNGGNVVAGNVNNGGNNGGGGGGGNAPPHIGFILLLTACFGLVFALSSFHSH
jgi:hypothetical protein